MLQHVALEIAPADTEAALAFWRLLDFEPVEVPRSLGSGVRWVERSGTQVHLLETEQPTAPPLGHPAVVVDDYTEAVGRLRMAGHPVTERRRHWGAARAFATAPGGHRVELMESPPPATRGAAHAPD